MNTKNNNNYIPYLDGCRGIAIAIVVLSHAGLGNIIPGKFGVTFFFFISGFLITKLLLFECTEKGNIGIKDFYLRRFFRLYPALLSMIIVSMLFANIMQCFISLNDILSALFYFTNYYIGWFRDPVNDCARILDIIWSLSVEEHFYFFFPFLTWLFLKNRRKKSSQYFLNLLFGLCLLALLARLQILISHDDNLSNASGRIYFSSHTRMDSILWGCISALLLFELKPNWYLNMLNDQKYLYVGLLLLFLSVAIRNNTFRDTLLFSFQGIGLLLIVPSLGVKRRPLLMKMLENRVLIFIGRISYSLYLFHWIALKFANNQAEEFSFRWHMLFWPLSILLSISSFLFVERPFIAIRRKFGSHTLK